MPRHNPAVVGGSGTAVTITVVGNVVVKVDESDYDGVSVSVDIKVMDGAVELGAKTISVVVSRYTANLYTTTVSRLRDEALAYKKYCVRQRAAVNAFANLAADLQAVL